VKCASVEREIVEQAQRLFRFLHRFEVNVPLASINTWSSNRAHGQRLDIEVRLEAAGISLKRILNRRWTAGREGPDGENQGALAEPEPCAGAKRRSL